MANSAFQLGGGKVLQVVSVTKTDTFSTSTTTATDITGMSVDITPTAASSKILVGYSLNLNLSSSNQTAIQIYRDSTLICAGDAASTRPRASAATVRTQESGGSQQLSINNVSNYFLDSPATTDEVTYKLTSGFLTGGTLWINRSTDDQETNSPRTASTIFAIEIGA